MASNVKLLGCGEISIIAHYRVEYRFASHRRVVADPWVSTMIDYSE